jgi:hypothetical protein
MKQLTVLILTLLLSSTVWGQFKDATTNQKASFVTSDAQSQAEAEQLATTFVSELYDKSSIELSHYLPTPHRRVDKRTTKVTGTTVSYKTNVDSDGAQRYQAVILVSYFYEYRAKK